MKLTVNRVYEMDRKKSFPRLSARPAHRFLELSHPSDTISFLLLAAAAADCVTKGERKFQGLAVGVTGDP